MGDKQLLEDAKLFLRSTLVSKQHGVQQSKIEHDYEELVGEKLPWQKLGFKNLFEFLMSIPEVAKLEWREEDEDNRVFAVLDGDSYASLHAKRMSVKGFGRGSRPLNPDEINEWKIMHGSSTSESDVRKNGKKLKNKNNKNSNKSGNQKINNRPAKNQPKKTNNDVSHLNHKSFSDNNLKYMPVSSSQKSQGLAGAGETLSKYKGLLPNAKGLYSLCVQLKNVPKAAEFDTAKVKELVKNVFNLTSCKIVECNAISSSMVFVRYRTVIEAVTVIEALHGHQLGGIIFDVSPAIEKTSMRSSASSNDVVHLKESGNNGLLQLPSLLQQNPFHGQLGKQGLLPTPLMPVYHINLLSEHQHPPPQAVNCTVQHHTDNASQQDMKVANHKLIGAAVYPKSSSESVNSIEKEMKITAKNCKFVISEADFVKMCFEGSRQKPKVASDLQDQIKFIVTVAEDACRFWIHLLEQESEVTQLMSKLQIEINELNSINAPKVFPSVHHFGAAMYSGDGLWYRCWVLDSSKKKNQIGVLYCDYGNYETVSIENFRHIHNSLWTLLPQAIPVKLHGVEIAPGLEEEKREEGLNKLDTFCLGKLLQGDVVKCSEPECHIIELKNVCMHGSNDKYLEDIMIELGYLEKTNSAENLLPINGVTTVAENGIKKTADFDFETIDLTLEDGYVSNWDEAEIMKSRRSSGFDKKEAESANFTERELGSNGVLAATKQLENPRFEETDNEEKNHSSCPTNLIERCNALYRCGVERELDGNEIAVSGKEIENLRSCSGLFEINPQKVIKVEILAVESPKMFHIKTRSSNELKHKVHSLLASYSAELKANPVVGSKVCYCDMNEKVRVQILDLACNFAYSRKVLVIDVDSGQKIWANVDDLYTLSGELAVLPDVVSKAALAGITTKNQITNVNSSLNELVKMEIFAHIIGKDSGGIYFVELFKDDHSKSINIEAIHKRLASVVFGGPFGVSKQRKGQKNSQKETQKGPLDSHKKKSRGNRTRISNGLVSENGQKDAILSDSSFVSGSSRSRSQRNSFSSESAFSDDSSSSGGVKYRPNPLRIASSTFGEMETQYKDFRILEKGSGTSKEFSEDRMRQHGSKADGSHVQAMENITTDFNVISLSKLETDDVEITAVVYNNNRGNSSNVEVASKKQRFRPRTPPLPSNQNRWNATGALANQDKGDGTKDKCDPEAVHELISSVRSLEKDHSINDLITFNDDGILNRDLIEFEMKRWEAENQRLQKYIANLNEALESSHHNSGVILSKNRKKRLELHVNIMVAEKELSEVTKELNELGMGWF